MDDSKNLPGATVYIRFGGSAYRRETGRSVEGSIHMPFVAPKLSMKRPFGSQLTRVGEFSVTTPAVVRAVRDLWW